MVRYVKTRTAIYSGTVFTHDLSPEHEPQHRSQLLRIHFEVMVNNLRHNLVNLVY